MCLPPALFGDTKILDHRHTEGRIDFG